MFDFDGTLSDVVEDPARARPREGVVGHLEALDGLYRRVGVVSGRPVSFLSAHLPADLFLSGLYGMEEVVDGALGAPDEFRRWQPVVSAAVTELVEAAAADPDLVGVEVEDKGLSATVHYRRRPGLGDVVEELARQVASGHGLDVRAARMSVEVHPPVPTDKGAVVRRLVEGLGGVDAVVFVGDDIGDLPAFDALGHLRAEGLTTVAVAVESSEMDPRMREHADVVIGVADVEQLLRSLRFGAGVDG